MRNGATDVEEGHAFVKMTDEGEAGAFGSRMRTGPRLQQGEMSDVPLISRDDATTTTTNGGVDGGGRDDEHPLATTSSSSSPSRSASAATTLPPIWVDSAEQADALIADVRTKIAQYQELRQFASRMAFPDEEEEVRNSARMRELSARISKRLREAEARIKSLSSPDDQVRINVQHSLAQKLQVEFLKWRKIQKEQLQELQRQQRQSKMALASSNPSSYPVAEEVDDDPLLAPNGNHEMTMNNLRKMDTAMMRERERELAQIARGIDDLAQLFKSISVLVIEQGTILDRIDYNMDNVVLKTEQGLKELNKAEEYQKGNCARNCITLLVVLNLVVLALLAAKVS